MKAYKAIREILYSDDIKQGGLRDYAYKRRKERYLDTKNICELIITIQDSESHRGDMNVDVNIMTEGKCEGWMFADERDIDRDVFDEVDGIVIAYMREDITYDELTRMFRKIKQREREHGLTVL